MRLLLINQFVPPDPSPTARMLGELGAALESAGHEVTLVGQPSGYLGKKTVAGSRTLREGLGLAGLLARALAAPRAEAVICFTSPPLLPAACRLVAARHRARLVHWAMDLYPEVAVTLGDVAAGSTLHRSTRRAMAGAYRRCDLVVALDEDMANRLREGGAEAPEILAPWPPAVGAPVDPPSSPAPGHPVWLYSGNLGRAHEWKTLLDAQQALESEAATGAGSPPCPALVFQGGGAECGPARAYADEIGLRHCYWTPHVDEATHLAALLAADALVATQRPETNGCLWPSKLALATLVDRPTIWVGAPDSAIVRWLAAQNAGHQCFLPGDAAGVAAAVRSALSGRQETDPATATAAVATRADAVRRAGFDRWAGWIETLSP